MCLHACRIHDGGNRYGGGSLLAALAITGPAQCVGFSAHQRVDEHAAREWRGRTTAERASSALRPAIDQPACLTDRSLDGFWFQYVHENAHADTILDVFFEDVASG